MATVGMLALLGVASRASALILTGGPTYSLPGGGSCSVSGIASQTGGATLNCTGVNLGVHSKVYFGIRNDTNVNGNTMTNVAPAPASAAVFRIFNTTPTSIIYTSTTTVADQVHGTQSVSNRLVLTLTSGSASIVSTGGLPANNNNGDIDSLFRVTSSNFTIRVDVQASDPFFAIGQACPAVFDPSHAPAGTRDISKVDVAFYFSDCGDSVVDGPDEECDLGAGNGLATSCCTAGCLYRSSAEVCRPGAGPPCDASENCTGLSDDCPIDDAPINGGMMVVCRPGSGDICDANEICTGAPGAGCPPDDAPGNTTIICRLSTTGDICDLSESCTGAPMAPCPPDDAPGKINFVCRPGSADVCDPDERCPGVAGQGCPPDVVANPSTVCRPGSGDSCDPAENCTAIPGQPCPANVVAPMGTQCRAAAGTCDVAEQCTGNAGQACPPNGFAAASTPCNNDGSVCTVDECNGSGACIFDSTLDCDDGNVCTQDSCDAMDGCQASGTPSMTCVTASKSILKIKKKMMNDASDSVKFLWRGGPALAANMGDPTQSTRYELCVYDNRGPQMAMGVPPGAGWTAVGPPSARTGYKYKDATAQNQGIKVIKTKGSSLDKGRAKVTGKGMNLPDLADLPFVYPVTAQLYASDGMCWEASFGMAETRANDDENFKAKAP